MSTHLGWPGSRGGVESVVGESPIRKVPDEFTWCFRPFRRLCTDKCPVSREGRGREIPKTKAKDSDGNHSLISTPVTQKNCKFVPTPAIVPTPGFSGNPQTQGLGIRLQPAAPSPHVLPRSGSLSVGPGFVSVPKGAPPHE